MHSRNGTMNGDHKDNSVSKLYFYFLVPVSTFVCLTACYGSYRMMGHCYRIRRSKSVSNVLLMAVSISNVVASYLCIPLHITKIFVDFYDHSTATSHLCLFRYFLTFSTVYMSLWTLSALIYYRQSQVNRASFGLKTCLNMSKVRYLVTGGVLLILGLNLPMLAIYYLYFLEDDISPCSATSHSLTKLYTLGIIESIKSTLFTGPLIYVIIRCVWKLRQTVKSLQNGTRNEHTQERMRRCMKRVNASFLYGGTFLIFWVPFAAIAFASRYFPSHHYTGLYNIGYTICYGYLACLPLICVMTDDNFKRQRTLSTQYNGRMIEVVPASSGISTSRTERDQISTPNQMFV